MCALSDNQPDGAGRIELRCPLLEPVKDKPKVVFRLFILEYPYLFNSYAHISLIEKNASFSWLLNHCRILNKNVKHGQSALESLIDKNYFSTVWYYVNTGIAKKCGTISLDNSQNPT